MPDAGEFYVGYLKTPGRLARFLVMAAVCLLAGAWAVAWGLAKSQNDPGSGVWHDTPDGLVGRLSASPYPMLRRSTHRPDAPVESILLVSEGKHGPGQPIAAMDGRTVSIRGTILERDGRRLLELDSDSAVTPMEVDGGAAAADSAASVGAPTAASMGRVTLRGEIIDPKCYSGAMKPGEGKAHKECATLCIAGGIPPMFVTLDAKGRKRYYLLTDAAGHGLRGDALSDGVLPFVADDVEITGDVEQHDDLTLLKIGPHAIRRR